MVFHDDYSDLLQSNAISTVWYAIGVYLNLYWLLPKLLLKKRYWQYGILLTTIILIIAYFTALALYYYFNSIYEPHLKGIFFASLEGYIFLLTELTMLVAITSVFYLLKEWYQKERRLKELENKNLITELSVLKSQVNPHFLFNALNSVYVLIKDDQEKARKTLANISELLSHQLYDGNKEIVSLDKELNHIKNYIALEKVRQGKKVQIHWQLEGDINGKTIAPMLLIPFVENAFKHGLKSGLDPYSVDIQIKMDNNKLYFTCSNQYKKNGQQSSTGGVGLINVKRRLALLYAKIHDLKIDEHEDLFQVKLNLVLNEN